MPAEKPKIERVGNIIVLKRDQWKNHTAIISDYPGLLDEVMKYTWSYQDGNHPYLKCGKLKTSLHRFVLSFLYGEEQLRLMLENGNIIEHLDNDGLNCTYDNLHVVSADYNKMKAFSIDKERELEPEIPSFITDVYYSHEKQYYQMQVFFNRNIFYSRSNGQPIEKLFFQYDEFINLFLDWVYIYQCRQQGEFELSKFHKDRMYAKTRPVLIPNTDENDHILFQRAEGCYLRLNPDGEAKMTSLKKDSFKKDLYK